jgi:AAA domain
MNPDAIPKDKIQAGLQVTRRLAAQLGISAESVTMANNIPSADRYPESADDVRDGLADAAETANKLPRVDWVPAAPLALITPAQWRGVPIPPMRWLATGRIPATDVAILSGDGGQGKTTVALQLAVSVAAGLGDWLGTVCEQGPVIVFSGEEDEPEMRRRLDRVARKRGLEADKIENLHFYFADPEKSLLGISTPAGTIVQTPLFASLAASVKQVRPALIVVDSVAATFGGNYVDRVQVRMFVSLFRQIAREAPSDAPCSVLLLDHPSLSGMTNGSGRGGSMDWRNATRAFMYLRPTDNDDGSKGRELEVMKINSGPTGEIQKLRFEDGCFVLEGSASAPQQAAAFAGADQTYLACLDATTAQGRNVFAMDSCAGYAPKVFAAMPQAAGITKQGFARAQERLFDAGKIGNVAYGPPSKGTKRIERVV